MDRLYVEETSIPVDEMEARVESAARNHQFGMFGAEDLDPVAQSVERDLIAIIDEASAEK